MIGFIKKLLGFGPKKKLVRRTGFIDTPRVVNSPQVSASALLNNVVERSQEHLPSWYQKFLKNEIDPLENSEVLQLPESDEGSIRVLQDKCQAILPPPPSSFGIYEKVANPDTPAKEVSIAVSSDPALASLILKTVNTVAYGFGTRIDSLGRAIVLMGYNAVKTVVLSQTLEQSFAGLDREMANKIAFHGKATSALCWVFAKNSRSLDPNMMSTIGLLHDLGKLIALHKEMQDYLNDSKLIPVLSESILGSTFAESWNLPDIVSRVIRIQASGVYGDLSTIDEDVKRPLAILTVSNYLAELLGFSCSEEQRVPSQACLDLLGLSPDPKTWLDPAGVMEIEKAVITFKN